jgi:TonB-dependent SusC/RagA subfamily outer membrane receptor
MNTYSMIKKATALLFAVWSGGTSLVMAQQPGDMITTDSSAGWKAKNYASVSGKDLEKTPVANLTNTLYGRLNGLMVAQSNGQPGYDQASMLMRGRGTYDQAAIVCYVDGFQVDISFYFQYLSAGEIENITLLKDPVTLATFGMKGANGILWVTTKRAKSGQFRVDAQMISGIPMVHINMLAFTIKRSVMIAMRSMEIVINGLQLIMMLHCKNTKTDEERMLIG